MAAAIGFGSRVSLRVPLVLAASLSITACATLEPGPGFRAEQPAALDPAHGFVAVVGDLQVTPWLVRVVKRREPNLRVQRRLIADLRERVDEIAALAIVGDLVFNARSAGDWAHFDALIGPVAAEVPVLPALGNHDYRCWFVELCSQRVVPEHVRLRFPWLEPGTPYAVAYGDVALLFLDSETRLAAQGRWLAERLDALESEYRGVVVFMHRSPFTDTVDPEPEQMAALREHVVRPLRETSLTPLLVSGHEHGYEHLRVDGVDFVVSAGGGGARDRLEADRPRDVYTGRNCARGSEGTVLRPFNYLLVRGTAEALEVRMRGLCRDDETVAELAAFRVPFAAASPPALHAAGLGRR